MDQLTAFMNWIQANPDLDEEQTLEQGEAKFGEQIVNQFVHGILTLPTSKKVTSDSDDLLVTNDKFDDIDYSKNNLIKQLTHQDLSELQFITHQTFTAPIQQIVGVIVNQDGNLQWQFTSYGRTFDAELNGNVLSTKVHGIQATNDSIEIDTFEVDKNCSKGISCGASCIAANKICRKTINANVASQGRAIRDRLVAGSSATPEPTRQATPEPKKEETNQEPKPVTTAPIRSEGEDQIGSPEVNYDFKVNDHDVKISISDFFGDGDVGSIRFMVNGSYSMSNMTPRERLTTAIKIKSTFQEDVKSRPDGFIYHCAAWDDDSPPRDSNGQFPEDSPAFRRESAYLAMGFKRDSDDPHDYDYGFLTATVKNGKIEK